MPIGFISKILSLTITFDFLCSQLRLRMRNLLRGQPRKITLCTCVRLCTVRDDNSTNEKPPPRPSVSSPGVLSIRVIVNL